MGCEKEIVRKIFDELNEINQLKKDINELYTERSKLVFETLKKIMHDKYNFEIKCCVYLIKDGDSVYIKYKNNK